MIFYHLIIPLDKMIFTKNQNNDTIFFIDIHGYLWYYDHYSFGEPASDEVDDLKLRQCKFLSNKTPFIVDVLTDDVFALALDDSGDVWGCGVNTCGQLGLGDCVNRNVFSKITTQGNFTLKSAVIGYERTFIFDNLGDIWCCGDNRASSGQLGISVYGICNQLTRLNLPNQSSVDKIVNCRHCTYFLDKKGNLWFCGKTCTNVDSYKSETVIKINPDKVKFKTIEFCNNFYAIDFEGKLWGFGDNDCGTLGVGDWNPRNVLTPLLINENISFTDIDFLDDLFFALDTNCHLWVCGRNMNNFISQDIQCGNVIPILTKLNIKNVKTACITEFVHDETWLPSYFLVVLDNFGSIWFYGYNDCHSCNQIKKLDVDVMFTSIYMHNSSLYAFDEKQDLWVMGKYINEQLSIFDKCHCKLLRVRDIESSINAKIMSTFTQIFTNDRHDLIGFDDCGNVWVYNNDNTQYRPLSGLIINNSNIPLIKSTTM